MASNETAVLFEEIARLHEEIARVKSRLMGARLETFEWREGRRVICSACHGTGSDTRVFPVCGCEVCRGDGSVLTEAAKLEDAALAEMEGG